MQLPEALDSALRARYMGGEIRRPITHRTGLTARLNAIQKHFPTQKAMAAALGVSPRTVQRWRSGDRKPDAPSRRKVEGVHNRLVALPRLRARINKTGAPNSVAVSAAINWNGYKNRTEYRSTTLGGMRHVMHKVVRAWATAGPQAAAQLFEQGAAAVNNVPSIKFEGDSVEVSFPWD